MKSVENERVVENVLEIKKYDVIKTSKVSGVFYNLLYEVPEHSNIQTIEFFEVAKTNKFEVSEIEENIKSEESKFPFFLKLLKLIRLKIVYIHLFKMRKI